MNDLDRLLAIEEIKLLRYRWSRFVDCAQWNLIPGLLCPDAELDLSATRQRALGGDAAEIPNIRGPQQIAAWLEQSMRGLPDQLHIVTMPEITFLSGDEAQAIWRQESFIPNAAARGAKVGVGYGTIHDTYRKMEGCWLMRTMQVGVELVL